MGFTYNYSQPEEYHFSLDSVMLAEEVAKLFKVKKIDSDLKVLDLCAGCGVVGFEFNFHRPEVNRIDFVEVQDVYQSYFEKNLKITNKNKETHRLLIQNYRDLISGNEKYDLIISNPPYFKPGQGKFSPSEFKNRCRFFMDATFADFVEAVLASLAEDGRAFFLIRKLDEHGWDQQKELDNIIRNRATASTVANIRGTNLIQLELFNE